MRTFFCAVLLCLHVAANASSESTEMKRVIDTMQEVYHVSFVYDSALADVTPAGRPLPDKTLAENLNIVLAGLVSSGKSRMNMCCCSGRTSIPFRVMSVRIMVNH